MFLLEMERIDRQLQEVKENYSIADRDYQEAKESYEQIKQNMKSLNRIWRQRTKRLMQSVTR